MLHALLLRSRSLGKTSSMKLLLPFAALLLSSSLIAQPVLTSTELLPALGAQPVQDYGFALTPGPAQANFTFDASGFVSVQPTQLNYLETTATPFISTFPQATHAFTDLSFPNVYAYYQATSTEVFYLGLEAGSGWHINTDTEKVFDLPMTYGNAFTDTWVANVRPINGPDFIRTGTSTVTYNGYGTVILTGGTYTDCARIETNQVYSDTSVINSTANLIRNAVTYFKPGLSFPVFHTEVTLGEFTLGFDTLEAKSFSLNELSTGIHALDAPGILARVYPNPANDHTTLQLIEALGTNHSATLLDATGRTVRVLSDASNFRTRQLDIDVSGLTSGTYFIRVCDGDGRTGTVPLMVE